jgi:transcriptional regulator with XRE-family HTH domain
VSEPAHLGQLLQRLRERKGIARRDVAERFKVAETYPWELEGQYSCPSPKLLEEILDGYDATTEDRLLAYRLRARATPRPRGLRKATGNTEETSDPDTATTEEAAPVVAAKGAA